MGLIQKYEGVCDVFIINMVLLLSWYPTILMNIYGIEAAGKLMEIYGV